MPPRPTSPHRSARLRATTSAMRATAGLARLAGRGGSVLGGHLGLRLDRDLIAHLSAGRRIIAVSATNGKTTTTRFLAAALGVDHPVVTNARGSNLRTGLAAALAEDLDAERAVLEVDEATLANVASELQPELVVLGNLSRDQLDRYGEVRIIAERWRSMFTSLDAEHAAPAVVANADDPLVVWSVPEAIDTTWVAAGAAWTADAEVCPACTAPIEHGGGTWTCTGCDLGRPEPAVEVVDATVVFHDPSGDVTVPVELSLPGAFNVANAALALTAARHSGIAVDRAAHAMRATDQVEGRYRRVRRGDHDIRLLMAKNPAGWQAALGIIDPPPTPIIVAINARVADGHDPSWLYDVPFEQLVGHRVIAAGDRAADLSVRLHYAGVDHTIAPGRAPHACDDLPGGPVDVVANYTAFTDALGAL